MSQIKSKDRVKNLAEVYTNESEVKAMLDLIKFKNEDDIISWKYLEPSCGNGNFLTEIVARKLNQVHKKYSEKSLKIYEFYICRSISNVFGIDICPENVQESKERLMTQIKSHFDLHKGSFIPSEGFFEMVSYILESNIVVGDSLNHPENIHFIEFKVKGQQFERRVYCFSDLVQDSKPKPLEIMPFKHFLKIGKEAQEKQIELAL